MTGEITLRGEVLAIGGLNEKLLAAQRSGVTTVLIPQENVKDLPEIPAKVKEGLTLVPISTIEEALPYVFAKRKARKPRRRRHRAQDCLRRHVFVQGPHERLYRHRPQMAADEV